MYAAPIPPRGFEGWHYHQYDNGMVRWTPPHPQAPPHHAFVTFPHKRAFQVTMIIWGVFVVTCFVVAWLTR